MSWLRDRLDEAEGVVVALVAWALVLGLLLWLAGQVLK